MPHEDDNKQTNNKDSSRDTHETSDPLSGVFFRSLEKHLPLVLALGSLITTLLFSNNATNTQIALMKDNLDSLKSEVRELKALTFQNSLAVSRLDAQIQRNEDNDTRRDGK